LATEKEQDYSNTIRDSITLLNTRAPSGELLDEIVHEIANTLAAGVSLVMLDSTNKQLIHTTSWGMAVSYLHKGVLAADKSLGETISGQIVVIEDIFKDKRVQYPELAEKAGIASILGVPILVEGVIVGALRVYMKNPCSFSGAEINFVTTMSKILALGIYNQKILNSKLPGGQIKKESEQLTLIQQVQKVVFAHPSEREFARLLDFYHIEWVYEPRSFPLKWEIDKVTEMFTPDFYLPGLDLYIELTTLKQSLVTRKNRKLRRLRELYPDIKITLLYKKDFDTLLAKHGVGPLADMRSRSINQVKFSTAQIQKRVKELAFQISRDYSESHPVLIGVLKGVFCFMADIVREMTIPVDIDFMAISYFDQTDDSIVTITKDIDSKIQGKPVIIIEDIVDTGMTLSYLIKHLKLKGPASVAVCTLLDKRLRRIADIKLDYIGFESPDEFLVGYGLDQNEEYRNLPYIGILGPKAKTNESKFEVDTLQTQEESE
jgi:bifunctional protein TilS/HprT